jgi:hypothetical protein
MSHVADSIEGFLHAPIITPEAADGHPPPESGALLG